MGRRNGILISNLTDCGRNCIRFDRSLYPLVITIVKDTGNDSNPNPDTDTGWTGFRLLFLPNPLIFLPFGHVMGQSGRLLARSRPCLPADRSERTVEQSSRKQESGSFHENRPLLLTIRELPPPDRCAGLAPVSPTPVGGRLKCSLKKFWVEDQLEFMRLRYVSTRVRCVGWRSGRGQRWQRHRRLPPIARFYSSAKPSPAR